MWLKLEMVGQTEEFLKSKKAGAALRALFLSEVVQSDSTNKVQLSLAFRLAAHLAQQAQRILHENENTDLMLV
jgi:hypothetical protein